MNIPWIYFSPVVGVLVNEMNKGVKFLSKVTFLEIFTYSIFPKNVLLKANKGIGNNSKEWQQY